MWQAAHLVEDGAECEASAHCGVGAQLMPEMVRNLDTGEVRRVTNVHPDSYPQLPKATHSYPQPPARCACH